MYISYLNLKNCTQLSFGHRAMHGTGYLCSSIRVSLLLPVFIYPQPNPLWKLKIVAEFPHGGIVLITNKFE